MRKVHYAAILCLLGMMTGCALFGQSGCTGAACKRPDSNDSRLVIWWPQNMRQGLPEGKGAPDFTVTPRED